MQGEVKGDCEERTCEHWQQWRERLHERCESLLQRLQPEWESPS